MPQYITTERGMEPKYRVKNPKALDWGCVTAHKNGKLFAAQNFWEMGNRRKLVIQYNKIVLNRKNKYDKYVVNVNYGKVTNEFSRT
jgi:hypothetical protein